MADPKKSLTEAQAEKLRRDKVVRESLKGKPQTTEGPLLVRDAGTGVTYEVGSKGERKIGS